MAKQTTPSAAPAPTSSGIPVQNPWLNISWQNTVASIDSSTITPAFCAQHGIDITDLPGPYMGDINSNVVVLSLNPGISPYNKCFIGDTHYEKLMQDTLKHSINRHVMIYDNILCNHNGKVLYPGCDWWRKRTKVLCRIIYPKKLNIFVLEYFPYHTVKTINFPKLSSVYYRNYLLEQAIKKNKLIVIMRGAEKWYGIQDNDLGKRLKDHNNKITLKNPLCTYLTPGNMAPQEWNRLIAAL